MTPMKHIAAAVGVAALSLSPAVAADRTDAQMQQLFTALDQDLLNVFDKACASGVGLIKLDCVKKLQTATSELVATYRDVTSDWDNDPVKSLCDTALQSSAHKLANNQYLTGGETYRAVLSAYDCTSEISRRGIKGEVPMTLPVIAASNTIIQAAFCTYAQGSGFQTGIHVCKTPADGIRVEGYYSGSLQP